MRTCFVCSGLGRHYAHFQFWAEYQFEIRWCDGCALGWVPELPKGSIFADAYERWNVLSWQGKKPASLSRDVKRAYLKGVRVAGEFLRHYSSCTKKIQVLEIGSNIGAVLKGVADRLDLSSEQLLGIDFSRNHAEVAQKKFGFQTLISDFSAAAAKLDRRFDLILAHHIIEHDEDPLDFLRNIKRLLVPGGVVSFELPNGLREASNIRILEEKGKSPYSLINHINFFSPRGFEAILAKAGFEKLHLCTMNSNNVLHDFGVLRSDPHAPLSAPRLSEVSNESVIESFPDSAVRQGIKMGRRHSKTIRFTHNWLRPHYPSRVPLGRDIEAYVRV